MAKPHIATIQYTSTAQVEFDPDELHAAFGEGDIKELLKQAIGEDFFGPDPFDDGDYVVGDVQVKAIPGPTGKPLDDSNPTSTVEPEVQP